MKKTFFSKYPTKGKDFAWVKKRNPFVISENSGLPLKIKIYAAIIIISLCTMFYLLFFHSFFQIQKLTVTGLDRIDPRAFEDSVHSILHFKKLLFFPGESYVLVNNKEVVEFLKEKYPIKRIRVEKSFPQTLSLEVEERISNVIYDDGKQYSYLDLTGNTIELLRSIDDTEWKREFTITTSTLPNGEVQENKKEIARTHVVDYIGVTGSYGDYPIVYDRRIKTDREEGVPVLKEKTIQLIILWFETLKLSDNLSPAYFDLEDEYKDLAIVTKTGPKIFTSLQDPFDIAVEDLYTIIEKNSLDLSRIQYIDLRFPPNIYWK